MWKPHHALGLLRSCRGSQWESLQKQQASSNLSDWSRVFCKPFVYNLCLYCALRSGPFQVTDGWHFWTRHVVLQESERCVQEVTSAAEKQKSLWLFLLWAQSANVSCSLGWAAWRGVYSSNTTNKAHYPSVISPELHKSKLNEPLQANTLERENPHRNESGYFPFTKTPLFKDYWCKLYTRQRRKQLHHFVDKFQQKVFTSTYCLYFFQVWTSYENFLDGFKIDTLIWTSPNDLQRAVSNFQQQRQC